MYKKITVLALSFFTHFLQASEQSFSDDRESKIIVEEQLTHCGSYFDKSKQSVTINLPNYMSDITEIYSRGESDSEGFNTQLHKIKKKFENKRLCDGIVINSVKGTSNECPKKFEWSVEVQGSKPYWSINVPLVGPLAFAQYCSSYKASCSYKKEKIVQPNSSVEGYSFSVEKKYIPEEPTFSVRPTKTGWLTLAGLAAVGTYVYMKFFGKK